MSHASTLIVFAREPRLGRVKTRLAATIGAEAALEFYRRTLKAVLGRLEGQPWRILLAVTPDEMVAEPGLWPTDTRRVPQGEGDLGQRMGRFLSWAASDAPIVIVGSDIPELTADHIGRAFRALADHDLALGPTADGGYWLIGASLPLPERVFHDVRWSTEHALADTLRNTTGLSVATLDALEDIDDGPSYHRFLARSGTQP